MGRCGEVWGSVGSYVWGGVQGKCVKVLGSVGKCWEVWGGEWGDVGRVGRCGEIWGDVGICGEIWGDMGRCVAG